MNDVTTSDSDVNLAIPPGATSPQLESVPLPKKRNRGRPAATVQPDQQPAVVTDGQKKKRPKGPRLAFYRVLTGIEGKQVDVVCTEETKGRALRTADTLRRIRGYASADLWVERCYRVS